MDETSPADLALATVKNGPEPKPAFTTNTEWRPDEAVMIASDHLDDGAPLLRTEFELEAGHGAVAHATLRSTSFGVFEAYLNGEPVGDDVLSPGWSSYEWRLRYRSYDLTGRLDPTNALVFALGNGWYRGRLGFMGSRRLYGEELAVLAELDIVFADGYRQQVSTHPSRWRSGPSTTTSNDLYDGQSIDARRQPANGWRHPGFDDQVWAGTHQLDFDMDRLVPAVADPVVRQESIRPQRIWTSPSGKTLIDFGQNLVGWLRFTVRGPAGQTITIRHAEVLEEDELGVRPLRSALATDRLTLSGENDTFEPTFTFHGFRYAEIDNWPGQLTADSVEAVVVHTHLRRIGTFACSNDDLNQLHRNVVWSLRGNFLDLPTDCPQRDERLGWTGDIAVFTPTAAYLYDTNRFLQDWLLDLAAEQASTGYVPVIVPDSFKLQEQDPAAEFGLSPATAIWGDAAVWVPWALWEAYGDRQVLEQQFSSMAGHVRSAVGLLSERGVWEEGGQFGDWLDPDAPPDNPAASKADPGVVSTAALYRSAVMVASAAQVLHHPAEATEFQIIAEDLRRSFGRAYVHNNGTIVSDCATVYALAITFGLLDDDLVLLAGHRLAEIVNDAGYHVSTGFAGTPYITNALSQTGHVEAAYRLLLEPTCPSWLYPVTMGATTIWERWDSMLPDGSINPGEMTSFNHYALGAVADWMHRVLVGISPAEPGYAKVRVAPQPGGGLTWAEGSLQTPHGPVGVRWDLNGPDLTVHIDLPDDVPAELILPGGDRLELTGGSRSVTTRLETAHDE